ncbi:MAG: SLC13 family permease, partial [Actinomycetota bacterium]
LVAGVIDERQALSGFSNPAPITVVALFVLAGAVEMTGALDGVTARLFGSSPPKSERVPRGEYSRILVPLATMSAVVNNTPIVAMAAPRVQQWARLTGRSPAKYLMPLSFAAILGGLLTTIGTSTNLVVSGLLQEAEMTPLGLFEVSRMGVPVAIAGMAVLILVAPVLLKDRRGAMERFESPREFTVEMLVEDRGPMRGKTVASAGLRNLEGVYLVEIERDGRLVAPVEPEEILSPGDRLIFAGNVAKIVDLMKMGGLAPAEERHFSVSGIAQKRLFEVVIGTDSLLAGTTLKSAGFRGRYGGAVLAIHRSGERIGSKLGEEKLRPGDVLLVLGDFSFRQRWGESRDFLLVSPVVGGTPVRKERALIVQLAFAGLIIAGGTGVLTMLEASLVAAAAVVGLGALTPREARNAVDLNTIVVLTSSFGLGAAVSESGLAEVFGRVVVDFFGSMGDVGLVAGLLLATTLLTGLISNNAAAVLMFPIALATAIQAGVDPRPLAITIMLGASTDFLTPIGYQTNTMVYGIGGYRFSDFSRLGLPLTLTVLVVGTLVIPLGWPLR